MTVGGQAVINFHHICHPPSVCFTSQTSSSVRAGPAPVSRPFPSLSQCLCSFFSLLRELHGSCKAGRAAELLTPSDSPYPGTQATQGSQSCSTLPFHIARMILCTSLSPALHTYTCYFSFTLFRSNSLTLARSPSRLAYYPSVSARLGRSLAHALFLPSCSIDGPLFCRSCPQTASRALP